MNQKTIFSRREFLKHAALMTASIFSLPLLRTFKKFCWRSAGRQTIEARYYTRADHLAG